MKYLVMMIAALVGAVVDAGACTSAIVGARRSASGRVLLWKHRDTSHTQNFVARGHGSRYDFVALFNAGDSLLREAWAGVNSAGFAVVNTQSYNLAPDTATVADREGLVMAEALGRCASLADFEALLDSLPRPMGVQANFGVMDLAGNAAWYETGDHGYRKYDVADDSLVIRTNFSCSGSCGAGLGRERYAAATALLADRSDVTPALLTDTVSCSFYPHDGRRSYEDRGQYIPRYSTSASVVIEQGGVMTVRPGYPPVAEATYSVTLDSIPPRLLPDPAHGWKAPAWVESAKRRDALYRTNQRGIRIVTFP